MVAASVASSDGYMENTDYLSANLFLYSTLESELLKSSLMVGWNQKAFGANAFYTPRFPEQYEETGSWLTALKVETQNPAFRIFGHAYWRRHRDHFMLFRSDPAVYENYHMTDVTGLAAGAKISSAVGFTTMKAGLRNEQIHSTTLGDPLIDPVKIRGEKNHYYDRFKSRSLLSLSADHHVQLNRLHLNGGLLLHALANGPLGSGQPGLPPGSGQSLQPERSLQAGLYPGIDLSFLLRDGLTAFASVNRSMRLPTYTDLYYEGPQNQGNPDLLPEKAVTFETGLKYDAAWLRADLALFYRKGVETIDWIWKDSIWRTSNLTDLDTYGGEVSLNLLPVTLIRNLQSASATQTAPHTQPSLSAPLARSFSAISHLRIAYSYVELSKSSDTHISNYALDNLKHKLIFDLGLKLPLESFLPTESLLSMKNSLHAEFFLDGKATWQQRNGAYLYYETPQSAPHDTPYNPFWLIDLRTGVRLNKITLFADVTNVLNTAYRDIGSVVMPGRWFTAGVKIVL